jgi:PHD/YefM family antitoxin component YafN of YafNO toxin-antitoxin module
MQSLNRLISLARRTGDRLIIHQPEEGEDIVIMNVDEYEALMEEEYELRDLSERQLLDKINRDIAIWRANDRLDYEDTEENLELEDEEDSEFDFDDDTKDDDWHAMGSVLGDKYDGFFPEEAVDNISSDDIEDSVENDVEEDISNASSYLNNLIDSFESKRSEDEITTEEIGEIPFKPEVSDDIEGWQEEEIGDDDGPVFYEEPV